MTAKEGPHGSIAAPTGDFRQPVRASVTPIGNGGTDGRIKNAVRLRLGQSKTRQETANKLPTEVRLRSVPAKVASDDHVRQAVATLIDRYGPTAAAEFAQAIGTPAAKAHVRRASSERLARRLLDQMVERPAIRDRLVAAHGLSARTAERRIAAAIVLRQPSVTFGAAEVEHRLCVQGNDDAD